MDTLVPRYQHSLFHRGMFRARQQGSQSHQTCARASDSCTPYINSPLPWILAGKRAAPLQIPTWHKIADMSINHSDGVYAFLLKQSLLAYLIPSHPHAHTHVGLSWPLDPWPLLSTSDASCPTCWLVQPEVFRSLHKRT